MHLKQKALYIYRFLLFKCEKPLGYHHLVKNRTYNKDSSSQIL